MIAPMKKFLLVLLEKDVHGAPLHLRRLGIVHVEKFESSGETCASLETSLKNAQSAKAILSSNLDKKHKEKFEGDAKATNIIVSALENQSAISSLQDRISELRRETDRIRDWGDFSPALFSELLQSGFQMKFLDTQPKLLEEIPETSDYIRLPAPKGKVRIALLGGEQALPGFEEFKLPVKSLSRLEIDIVECEKKVAQKKVELARLAFGMLPIDREIERLESSLTIERLRVGMPSQDRLRYLSGYVPAKEAGALKSEAMKRGWAIALDDPSDEEMPPTKVENHPAVRIIQPVFNFLGTVPNYREYDISFSFLVFFSVYFAMIFGDGGYGLILLAGAAGMFIQSRKKKHPLSDFGRLLFVLSGATIAWGFVTATWFAIPFGFLPSVLQTMSLYALNGANPDAGTNTKILCFVIGAVQLALAHIKNIRRDFPSLKFLAQVGSLIMVFGMFNAVLNLVIDSNQFPLYSWALWLIVVGFILVFVFGNWNGNLLTSILEGVKGIIPTFLGTVSVFADIVSYIRLWAVGLAGLAISQTVNGMAVTMLGPAAGRLVAFLIGGVVALLLVFIGHTINLLMSVLSVIVHGIRLNMLEFSSHLGMEWSGYKYEPLSESAEERNVQENTI
jgi:V/A-type H+-transporting ATPase subunit I